MLALLASSAGGLADCAPVAVEVVVLYAAAGVGVTVEVEAGSELLANALELENLMPP